MIWGWIIAIASHVIAFHSRNAKEEVYPLLTCRNDLLYNMKCSKPGQFYGRTNETLFLNGIILNDSDYIYDTVDWHYHENAYFTFLLEGRSLDGNKKHTYECSAGSLLFQNWQDPHYNKGSKLYTRGFHVEIEPSWFASFHIPVNLVEGSIQQGERHQGSWTFKMSTAFVF